RNLLKGTGIVTRHTPSGTVLVEKELEPVAVERSAFDGQAYHSLRKELVEKGYFKPNLLVDQISRRASKLARRAQNRAFQAEVRKARPREVVVSERALPELVTEHAGDKAAEDRTFNIRRNLLAGEQIIATVVDPFGRKQFGKT